MQALMATADAVWGDLDPTAWLEAFAAHPRLGESGGSSPVSSAREQSRIIGAPGETLAELAEQNRLYEAKFGRVFLISAAGRSAEEILAALLERIDNDPTAEVKLAAEEQRKITRRRLESMLQG
jgi:OHCU decarboxylase